MFNLNIFEHNNVDDESRENEYLFCNSKNEAKSYINNDKQFLIFEELFKN